MKPRIDRLINKSFCHVLMTILEQLNCTDSKIDWNLSNYVMLPRLNKDFELKVGVQESGWLQRFPSRLSCIACEHQTMEVMR